MLGEWLLCNNTCVGPASCEAGFVLCRIKSRCSIRSFCDLPPPFCSFEPFFFFTDQVEALLSSSSSYFFCFAGVAAFLFNVYGRRIPKEEEKKKKNPPPSTLSFFTVHSRVLASLLPLSE